MSELDDFFLRDLEHKSDYVPAPNGDFQIIKSIYNLKQQLFHRLITVPGSIVHRPTYGVGVQLWQGIISSSANQQRLAAKIKEQFELDFRVKQVTGVRIEEKGNGLFIVTYRAEAKGYGAFEDTVAPFGDLSF